jgi:hypothetical protein
MAGEPLFGDAALDPQDLESLAERGQFRCALGKADIVLQIS